jgi:dihydrolipoamide dehydrogenase
MVMGEFTQETDLLVVGAGPGGYAAAFRAADLGLDVLLVDLETQPGGVCLYAGCIPSKTLLYAADLLAWTRFAEKIGLGFGRPDVDLDRLRQWKNQVIDELADGTMKLCQGRGVEYLKARAEFEGSNSVRLHNSDEGLDRITFRHAIIATGSQAIPLPGMEFKPDSRIMDAAAALDLPGVPKTLLVVGGGYVGLEMGSVYAALGSKITLVEMEDRLMSGADWDLVEPLAEKLGEVFEAVHLKTRVKELKEQKRGVKVAFEGEDEISEQTYERVLVAIGRRPNASGLGLENTQVEIDDQGFIQVDEQRRTADEAIFAIGDVVGGVMLAHKARHEGKVAAEVIAGEPSAFDARAVPAVVYTDPQIAWCGLTEHEAEEQQKEVQIARFPWTASGRAAALGLDAGMTKLVLDPETKRVLGVGIVGREAGELIAEGVLAVEMGALAQDLALSIHPHPTLSEGMEEAAGVSLGSSTHTLPQKE